jgi:hypothetical protein
MVVDLTMADRSHELLLVLPALLDAARCAGTALPRLAALETILARGDRAEGGDGAPIATLAAALPALAGADGIAPGPLSRLADTGLRDGEWWARADPVHLAPVRDHLRLFAVDALTMDESQALAEACSALLEQHGLTLDAPTPERWYLRSPHALDFAARDTARLAGRDLFPFLPTGPDGAFVRRLLTELQMSLHDHPVNRARERAGRLHVNSVWLWGGGTLDEPVSARVAATAGGLPSLSSDDAVLRGLWRLAGADVAPLPGPLDAVTSRVIATRAFENVASVADAAGCVERLQNVDAEWLQPALAGLRSNAIERVRLAPGRGIWSLHRRGLMRWWRRAKVLRSVPSIDNG